MRKTVFIVLVIFSLFLLRLQFLPKLDLKDGQKVKVSGILNEEPQVSGNMQIIKLGQFEATAPKFPEFHYGEKIEIIGKAKIKSFNRYQIFEANINVLKARPCDIRYSKASPCNTPVRPGLVKGVAISLKARLLDIYQKSFPGNFDGIVAGVVLGDKSLIAKDFWEKLKLTGTLHMMVASGMNIAMFSGGLLALLCTIFVRRISLAALICLIWFYTLMVGFQAPIVRAAVMATLLYLGQFFGREAEGGKILLTTGLIMLFSKPELLFDIGFQLSFLATGGLVWIQPIFKEFVKASPCTARGRLLKNDNFTSSISAQIATLPVLLLNFGSLNLISPLINLAVLWTIPFILQFGIILGILGIIGGVRGIGMVRFFSYLLYPLLFYLEQVINLSAKWTVFQWQAPKLGWWFAIIYYLALWLWVKRNSGRKDLHG